MFTNVQGGVEWKRVCISSDEKHLDGAGVTADHDDGDDDDDDRVRNSEIYVFANKVMTKSRSNWMMTMMNLMNLK